MLKVDGLDVDINGTPILRDIGLEIESGEIVGLIGRNGAGKTTFLRSLMGLLPIRGGKFVFEAEALESTPGYRRAHMGIGYMPEDRRLVPEMTAEENILVPVWSTNIQGYEGGCRGFMKSFLSVKDLERWRLHHYPAVNRSW